MKACILILSVIRKKHLIGPPEAKAPERRRVVSGAVQSRQELGEGQPPATCLSAENFHKRGKKQKTQTS